MRHKVFRLNVRDQMLLYEVLGVNQTALGALDTDQVL
jgi:hypothetical protein